MIKSHSILFKIHFYVLTLVILNFLIESLTSYGFGSMLIFVLKIVIYLSGFLLFYLNIKPFKKISLYFFFYFLSGIVIILFWIFGGIFLAICSSVFLKPIYPNEVHYQKNDIKIYSSFNGFLAPCCSYEISENKLFLFERKLGKITYEGKLDFEKRKIEIVNNEEVILSEPKERIKIEN